LSRETNPKKERIEPTKEVTSAAELPSPVFGTWSMGFPNSLNLGRILRESEERGRPFEISYKMEKKVSINR